MDISIDIYRAASYLQLPWQRWGTGVVSMSGHEWALTRRNEQTAASSATLSSRLLQPRQPFTYSTVWRS
jgi:hypothetical protein